MAIKVITSEDTEEIERIVNEIKRLQAEEEAKEIEELENKLKEEYN